MLDTCTLYAQARIIIDRWTKSILHGISEMWPFGAPRVMESDQHSGLISAKATCFLSQVGTTLFEKSIGAHARMVEKHHDMLRRTFLRVQAQVAEG
eukprot:12883218-Prorocentrum_lima.AAC.1